MAAQVPFQIAIPDVGVAAGFVDGENAIAVNSPQSSTAAGVYYLSRMLNLKGGTYLLKINGASSCSFWIGEDLSTSMRIAAYGGVQPAPVQAEFFVRAGAVRIDLVLSTLGGSAYVAFSLWKGGKIVYASGATDWKWDTSFVPVNLLTAPPDTRLALPVFAFTPNWKSGVTERLSWVTDVFASENDTEQRRSRLRHPRRSFEAQFLRSAGQRMRLNDFVVGVAHGEFIVPFWPEETFSPSPMSAGNSAISFPYGRLDGREFTVGGLVLIYDRDPARYEVGVIANITSDLSNGDVLHLVSTLALDWPTRTRVAPAYVATFDNLPSLANKTDRLATASIGFKQRETLKSIEPSWGYCSPLWRFKVDRRDALESTSSRLTFNLDIDSSPADVFDLSEATRVGMRASLNLFDRSRLNTFKSFVAMAAGRRTRFWWPTGTHDIEPAGSIGGPTLDVIASGFAEVMNVPQDARKMVGFYFKDDGPTFYSEIVFAEKIGGGNERLTFDPPLPASDPNAISRISFVMPVRFDQDTFEIHHHTTEAKARASVVVRSSAIEGMPPIDCTVNSWTYPVFAEDGINSSGLLAAGGVYEFPIEHLNLSGTIAAGTLVNAFVGHVQPHEDSVNLAGAFVSGTLVNAFVGHVQPHEDSVDISGTLTAGSLQAALISYQYPDLDTVDLSGTLVSGTLT
jgi:hypothetical protein